MKSLAIFFFFICLELCGQSDVAIQHVVIDALSERSNLSIKTEVLAKGFDTKPKDIWVCHSFSCVFGEVDLEGINLKVQDAKYQKDKILKGRITGRLVDKASKEPLLFASINLWEDGKLLKGTESDLDGNFIFSDLKPGVYDLEYMYVGYRSKRVKNIKIALVDAKGSSFHFYDEQTQEALIGVNVLVYKDDKYLTGNSSDNKGNMSLQSLEKGSYRFQFRYLGYEAIDKVFQISGNGTMKIPMKPSNFVLSEVVITGLKDRRVIGCVYTSSTVIETCSLNSVENSEATISDRQSKALPELSIFPNPSSDFIHLSLKEQVDYIQIITQDGRIMYRNENPQVGLNEISILEFPIGSYVVSIGTKEGRIADKLMVVR